MRSLTSLIKAAEVQGVRIVEHAEILHLMSGEQPPFDGDFYFDHWFVEAETGKRDEIIVPGIHDHKSIRWLYC